MANEVRSIDLMKVVRVIEERAVQALNKTLGYTLARAQHHAPVRSIFQRTRRGNETARIKTKATTTAGVMAAYRKHPFGSAEMLNQRTATGPSRRINTPRSLSLSDARTIYAGGGREALEQAADIIHQEKGRVRTGGANSEEPVFRLGKITIAGSRRVAGGKLVPTAFLRQSKGRPVKIRAAPTVGGEPVSASEFALSGRGRYEVRTGRAIFHAVGGDQIGGSLKHSIVKVEATLTSREKGTIWGYVRAGNEDVDYARWQEFGTGHNRAHPFLRPALYESRERFKGNVVNAVKGIKTRGR